MKCWIFVGCLFLWRPAAGQGTTPAQVRQLHIAYVRHLTMAQELLASQPTSSVATEYLNAVQTWYGSDLAVTVQGTAAEGFFAAHQALLRQRLLVHGPVGPVQAAVHDSSTAHLRQMVALIQKAHRLPEAAQAHAVQRLVAREEKLLAKVSAAATPKRP